MKKLKIYKKLLALTASALMLAALPNTNTLTASAAEPETYYIVYDGTAADGDWYYQTGSTWDDTAEHRDIHYMLETLKDGDAVIVGNASGSQLTLNVRLGNLTLKNTGETFALISVTGGIDNCFFLNDSHGAIDGNVANAYVYGNSTANFNSNVTNLYFYHDNSDEGPTIGVTGTVAYYEDHDSSKESPSRGAAFEAGSFHVENGKLTTPGEKYTPGATGPAASNTQTTATAKPSSTPAASSAADEYDKVPKTGESPFPIWLALLTASCLGISLILRKSADQ